MTLPVREAVRRWKAASKAGQKPEMDQAIRDAVIAATVSADSAIARSGAAAMAKAAIAFDAGDDARALQALQGVQVPPQPVIVRPVAAARADPVPEPLVREVGGRGSVLAVGEVALLSGAGGGGKSTLALQIALAAALGDRSGNAWQSTAGMDVAPGRSVLVTWEDRARRIYDRAVRIVKSEERDLLKDRVFVVEGVGPIFGPPETTPLFNAAPAPMPRWQLLFEAIAEIGPRLVVIDPVMSAFSGDSGRVEAVRLFLDALRIVAESDGYGVLAIAHNTKSHRSGGDTAGAIAGSAGWHDAARGVMTLTRDEEEERDRLSVIKANYGPRWSRLLKRESDFYGNLRQFIDDGAVEDDRPKAAVKAGADGKNRSADQIHV